VGEQDERREQHDGVGGEQQVEDELLDRDRTAQRQDEAADARDDQAKTADQASAERDRAAEGRDARATRRDVSAEENPATVRSSSADRREARSDRAEAAQDRTDAVDDRGRARLDRRTAREGRERAVGDRAAVSEAVKRLRGLLADAEDDAEDQLLIGQAQGLIMQRRELGSAEALLELCAQAVRDDSSLGVVARAVVASRT